MTEPVVALEALAPETPPVAVAPPAPVPAAPPGDAPWSTDLAALLPDETVRGQVDGYLREKIQPRMTQLEQELASVKPGSQMYADFMADPVGTYQSIGEQMFGPEFGAQLGAMFAADEETPATPPAEPAPLDPRVQAMLDDHTTEQNRALYRSNLDRLQGEDPANPQIKNESLFHPFVVAAEGDFDQAFAAYKAWEAETVAAFGPAAVEPPTEPVAPGTLGGEAAPGSTAPPVEQKYASLDDALKDTMAEMRAAREVAPTTVGAV